LPPQVRRLRVEPLEERCLLSINYDLQTDWSDAANPNGVWAYREGSNNLPHVNSWQSTLGGWSTAQPAWSRSENGSNRLPVIFKSNGSETFAHDWIAGDIIVHSWDSSNGSGNGLANIVWTSPGAGTIDITGSTWAGRDIGRSNQWNLYVNNSLVTFGSVASGDPYSRANPFNFAVGSGGAGVLNDVIVSAGDTVRFNVTATSPAGDFVGVNFQVAFKGGPPTVALNTVGMVHENGVATLTGSITDVDPLDTFTLDVNWGDPLSPNNVQAFTLGATALTQAANGIDWNPATRMFSIQHQYLDDNPSVTIRDTYTIHVTATDDDTLTGTDSETVLVENVDPQIYDPADVTIQESGTATLVTTVTDPGTLDVFSVTVHWQDGTPNTITGLGLANSSGTVGGTTFVWTAATRQISVSHQYLDDGASPGNGTSQEDYNVVLLVDDDDLGSALQLPQVTVQNVAPQISDPANVTIQENGFATLVTTVTDPGTLDVFSVDVNWQDGTSNTITGLGLANSSGTVGGTTFVWTAATRQLSVSHQYLDDGPSPGNGTSQENYNVSLTVSDDDLGTGTTQTATVTVENVAPDLVDDSGDAINEGQVAGIAFAIDDPGTLDVFTADVDWRDGSVATITGLGLSNTSGSVGQTNFEWTAATRRLELSHVYADNGNFAVLVTISDDDFGSNLQAFAVIVANVGPALSPPVVSDNTIDEGGVVSFTTTFSDPGFDNPNNPIGETDESFTYDINWGDGRDAVSNVPVSDTNGQPSIPSTGQFGASHVYADDGTYTVTVTIRDDDGGSDVETFMVVVSNVKPQLTTPIVSDNSIDEGGAVSFSTTFSDPGFDNPFNPTMPPIGLPFNEAFRYHLSWGDGRDTISAQDVNDTNGGPGVNSIGMFNGSHTYADNGSYFVTVRLADDNMGAYSNAALFITGTHGVDYIEKVFTVTVANAAPHLTVTPSSTSIEEGGSVSFTAEFSDPAFDNPSNPVGEAAETFTYDINWGDGQNTVINVPIADTNGGPGVPSTGSFIGNHTYQENGTYTVNVVVHDDDGGSSLQSFNVNVVSPPALVGDYNIDNVVDTADYIVWRKTLGNSVAIYTGADGNGDGIIGPEDHDVWRANFGNRRLELTNGLLGYWQFNGDGNDWSGNAHTLSLSGGIGFAAGVFDKSLDLNGNVSQYASRSLNDADLNFGSADFTLQVWVNLNTTAGEQVFVEKFSGASGPGWTLTAVATDRLQFYASPSAVITTAPLLTANQWHQILVQRTGNTFRLWYDGAIVGMAVDSDPVPTSTNGLLVGKRNPADGRGFPVNGRLDELAIWDHSLSDDEIAALWNNSAGRQILTNPAITQFHPGQLGNSLVLDGVDDDVLMGDPADNHLELGSTVTLEAWVKFSSLPSGSLHPIASKAPPGTSGWLWAYSNNFSGVGGGGPRTVVLFNGAVASSNNWTPVVGQWYHLAVVKNGTSYTFYRDGVADGTSTSLEVPEVPAPFILGQYSNLHRLHGALDDVRVWNTARSASEIANNRSAELAGNEAGLIGYWRFNELAGNFAADASPLSTAGMVRGVNGKTIGGWDATRGGHAAIAGADFFYVRFDVFSYFDATFLTAPVLTPAYLSSIDVLLLDPVFSSADIPITPLSASEQAALASWVSAGGRVLVVGENSSYFAASQSMIQPFGPVWASAFSGGAQTGTIVDHVSFPQITDGSFGSVTVFSGGAVAHFANVAPATSLGSWNASGNISLAAMEYGLGAVVVFGDSSLLSDVAGSHNTILRRNTLQYLLDATIDASSLADSLVGRHSDGNTNGVSRARAAEGEVPIVDFPPRRVNSLRIGEGREANTASTLTLALSQRERGLQDDALVAWLSSRDVGREEDAGHSRVSIGDGQDCPSYEDAIDDEWDTLDVAFAALAGGI
jgi:hypothetical protein